MEFERRLPETLAAACVGKLVGEVVDHAVFRKRDWLVTGIDASHSPFVGRTLIVAPGSTPYRMP